jgi:hypothetical protein
MIHILLIIYHPVPPPSHTSHISTPYIGGQFSMGVQYLAQGKRLVAREIFTGGNLHGCNINKPWRNYLLQVLLSILPLEYILDIHILEL